MHHLETKHDEVAGDMRREQSKQRNEADDVDESTKDKVAVANTTRPTGSAGNTGLVMSAPGTSGC
jgi:hypothetical protein